MTPRLSGIANLVIRDRFIYQKATRRDTKIVSEFEGPERIALRRLTWRGEKVSPDAVLVRAAERADRDGVDSWTALMRVLLDSLADLELPGDLIEARTVASSYWVHDDRSVSRLSDAKAAVWEWLDQRPVLGLREDSTRKARALLCVLEPGGNDEAESMTAEWFCQMLAER